MQALSIVHDEAHTLPLQLAYGEHDVPMPATHMPDPLHREAAFIWPLAQPAAAHWRPAA